jgi:large subunit ribosomal protein L21
MLAVIKTGGKQYLVSPGDKIKIEKVEKKEGDSITFDKVLLVRKNKKLEIGEPFVEKAKVTGKVLEQGKGDKVIVFKYTASARTQVKKGHRQKYTLVEIEKIDK